MSLNGYQQFQCQFFYNLNPNSYTAIILLQRQALIMTTIFFCKIIQFGGISINFSYCLDAFSDLYNLVQYIISKSHSTFVIESTKRIQTKRKINGFLIPSAPGGCFLHFSNQLFVIVIVFIPKPNSLCLSKVLTGSSEAFWKVLEQFK